MKKTHKGILFTLIAMFLFSATNALIKYISTSALFSSYKIATETLLFFRLFFSLIPTLVFFKLQKLSFINEITSATNKKAQILGAIITPIGLYCLFVSFMKLPLGDAQTISFSSGLFVTLLAYPLLGERVTKLRWISFFLGTFGILLIAKPGPGILQVGVFWGLAFSLIQAMMTLFYKKISAHTSTGVSMFYLGSISSIFLLIFIWPYLSDISLYFSSPLLLLGLIMIGIGGGVAQIFMVEGLKYAPSTMLTPFFYSSIIWGMFFDWLIWHHAPGISMIIGALIIIASNILVMQEKK